MNETWIRQLMTAWSFLYYRNRTALFLCGFMQKESSCKVGAFNTVRFIFALFHLGHHIGDAMGLQGFCFPCWSIALFFPDSATMISSANVFTFAFEDEKAFGYLMVSVVVCEKKRFFFFARVTVIPLIRNVRLHQSTVLQHYRELHNAGSAPYCWLRRYSSQDAACHVKWTARSLFHCLICWIGINRIGCLPKDISQLQTRLLCSRWCIYQTAHSTGYVH